MKRLLQKGNLFFNQNLSLNPDSALERNAVTVNCKSDDKVQNFLMRIVRNILEKIRA